MSTDESDGSEDPPATTAEEFLIPIPRLRLNPRNEHVPDNYEGMQLEYNPRIFSSMEKYLPLYMLSENREEKAKFMSRVMVKYLPPAEISRAKSIKEYREMIISNYEPLHKELYSLDPDFVFLPSFLEAIKENTEQSLRSVISEPFPGVLVFEMLQPGFCKMMISEVNEPSSCTRSLPCSYLFVLLMCCCLMKLEHFRNWATAVKFKIMKANTIDEYSTVLDDFGLQSMLDKFMEGFIRPVSKVFFPDVGGSTLDSHHGFVAEYGNGRGVHAGFHVDNSEVTLNVCLGKEFEGGELYFGGTRCDKHVNTDTKPEEKFDYCHKPGQAVVHLGRHRNGARATTSGHRVNMILWCRSSDYREVKKYQKEFPDRCGQCLQEKEEKQRQALAARRREFVRVESEAED